MSWEDILKVQDYCKICGEITYGHIDEKDVYHCGSCGLPETITEHDEKIWEHMKEGVKRTEDFQEKILNGGD